MSIKGQFGGRIALSLVAAVAAVGSMAAPAQAIELYRISTAPSTLNNSVYDASRVTITTAANVTGSSATDLSATETLSNIFANDNTAGGFGVIRMTDDNGTSLEAGEFGGGFMTFTVNADAQFHLNLESLQFIANRGGASLVRGFEVYGTVNGESLLFGATALLDIDDEVGTRATPTLHTIDLTDAVFQNVDSVTFRIYALTGGTGNSIEFGEIRLNGIAAAVPEPATALLGLAGLAGLAARRRRQLV